VDATLYPRRRNDVSPSGLCEFIFLVPVAYATGKYVSPSGLRAKKAGGHSRLRPCAIGGAIGPTKFFRKILSDLSTPVSDNAFELCGIRPVEDLSFGPKVSVQRRQTQVGTSPRPRQIRFCTVTSADCTAMTAATPAFPGTRNNVGPRKTFEELDLRF